MALAFERQLKVFCDTEYETLHKVILCQPKHMEIKEVINETQKQYKEENIDSDLATTQHREFIRSLEQQGVDVILIPPSKKYPEQVFTRDIGFTIGNTLFVAEMASDIRLGEEEILKNILMGKGIQVQDLTTGIIEGGDVIIDKNTVYIGISSRTNSKAVEQLKKHLTDYEIVPIPFKEKYLHLDCVFNILSPDEALYFPEALEQKTIEFLKTRFRLIEVSKDEQFTLGTNVLSIGKKRVFSLPINKDVNRKLKENGFEVIEVDISEIIKSGGSFRCCTLPILREEYK
ncbi:dimethylarginine dimethylaminohydrolase family protein [Lederbergia wuyishanensis]|uniref:N-dimethylarginine dimethylaminohydrolase n=1 Tax=Lederbergia wuyishanensis TaxID=1347903 RepID=A0ABU0D0C5_9BACI|nr:dimethylarginine dimethylaminohydrolase family protein [Lederbergia wuyishanensis]MCJ8006477.1 dimethylarginine dimethylaminohydrolase family protein [Lederbergia wuyishanensis]MDQ0341853.1 N-dimethylarginine dimethylaminohydrolase [Lederbergia wuyishanensis]